MIQTELTVNVERDKLTGDELMRMAMGVLVHNEHIPPQTWPEHTVYFDVTPADKPQHYTFLVLMCESEADEKEIETLNDATGEFYVYLDEALRFKITKVR